MSAGTLALLLTSSAAPATADEGVNQGCEGGDGLLSTVTGVVCDTTDTLTDTTTDTLDKTTGGATKDLSDGVKDVADSLHDTVHDTVRDTVRQGERGDGGSPDSSSSSDPDRSTADPSGSTGSDGAGGDESAGGAQGDDASRGPVVSAAGSSAGDRTTTTVGSGGGRFPHLQPLSPLADLGAVGTLDGATTTDEPKLPRIAPSPAPSPSPTPPEGSQSTRYTAPAGEERPFDHGEATPALMVIVAIIAAGVVTGGHVAVAKARIRNRNVG